MLATFCFLVFAGLLIAAAIWDMATLTIPNWLCATAALLFPIAGLAMGLSGVDVLVHCSFGLAILVVTFFMFQAGVFGGGDAKLLAAVAVWSGPSIFLILVATIALAGGGLALLLMSARANIPYIAGAPRFVNKLLEPKGGIPYGIAIMVGALATLPTAPLYADALTLP